jgi:3-hydroxyacyl-[acyl-carrier-protein] dehydratase
VIYDTSAVEQVNPHRYEMRLLDGIVYFDTEQGLIVGYKDTSPDDFWVRGHIPGRPLMPGVLMVEAAAQLASFAAKKITAEERFIAFGGIENVKFRAQISPGDRLYLLGKFLERRPRRFKLAAQGVSNGQLVFQAVIIGMPI